MIALNREWYRRFSNELGNFIMYASAILKRLIFMIILKFKMKNHIFPFFSISILFIVHPSPISFIHILYLILYLIKY